MTVQESCTTKAVLKEYLVRGRNEVLCACVFRDMYFSLGGSFTFNR